MGVETAIGAGLMGAGGLFGAFEQSRAASANRRQQNAFQSNISQQARNLAWNPSQDGYLQMLRADPNMRAAAGAYGGMLNAPTDFGSLLSGYNALDAQTNARQLASLQGTFTGLGQRFGSAAGRQTSDLLANLGAQQSARNVQVAQGAYEAAQQRRLAAAQGLSGLSQQAFSNEAARRQYNMQLLGIQAGVPQGQYQPTQYGEAFGGIGQFLALLPLLQGKKGTG